MRKKIFSNDYCDMAEELGGEPSAEKVYAEIESDLDEITAMLDRDLDGIIYAVGNIVRWNGSFTAFKKIGSNLSECLTKTFEPGENSLEFYTENGRFLCEQRGHDNPVSSSILEFRLFTGFDSIDDVEEMLYERLIEDNDINAVEKASVSLGDKVNRLCGKEETSCHYIDIFLSDLSSEKQKEILDAYDIESAEENNWDVIPVAMVPRPEREG